MIIIPNVDKENSCLDCPVWSLCWDNKPTEDICKDRCPAVEFEGVELFDDDMPTIEAEPFKAFAHWVASEVCNEGFEEMWTLGAFAEVACRKLYALGVVQKFRDEWVYVDKDELDGGENDGADR